MWLKAFGKKGLMMAAPITSRYYLQEYITLQKRYKNL
jgi:hypothetical protein